MKQDACSASFFKNPIKFFFEEFCWQDSVGSSRESAQHATCSAVVLSTASCGVRTASQSTATYLRPKMIVVIDHLA